MHENGRRIASRLLTCLAGATTEPHSLSRYVIVEILWVGLLLSSNHKVNSKYKRQRTEYSSCFSFMLSFQAGRNRFQAANKQRLVCLWRSFRGEFNEQMAKRLILLFDSFTQYIVNTMFPAGFSIMFTSIIVIVKKVIPIHFRITAHCPNTSFSTGLKRGPRWLQTSAK